MLYLLPITMLFNFLIGRSCGYILGKKGLCYIYMFHYILGLVAVAWEIKARHNILSYSYEVVLGTWIKLVQVEILWSFFFDSLSVVMLILVFLITLLVHLYSTEYMKDDPSFIKFMTYLSLFSFYMMVLVSAGNMLILFLGWEGVGLASYLLISFWTTRLPASKAGLKALIMNRIGDFFLILAICFTLKYFKTLDFVTLFAMVPYYTGIVVLICGVKFHVVDVIALLLVLAAAGKSAQLGLHTWLPDAMEGPTPVSALLHAATMVTAGVYLLLRCSHFLVFSPKVALFAVVLGTLTTLAGGFIALTQMDIKKIIAYSTCSQLGYMITACGSLNFSGSFFHLVNHAFFKALLFLTAGAIIHTLRGEQDIRRMGNLVYWGRFYYCCLLLSSLSLIGCISFSGYYSKELIINHIWVLEGVSSNRLLLFSYWANILGVFFTALYTWRLLFYVAYNSPAMSFNVAKYINPETPMVYRIVLSILAIASLCSGFFTRKLFASLFFSNSFYLHPLTVDAMYCVPYNIRLIPALATLAGIVLATSLFSYYDSDELVDDIITGSHKELESTVLAADVGAKPKGKSGEIIYLLFVLSNKRLFIDNFYNKIAALVPLLGWTIYRVLDKGILERIGPWGLFKTLERTAGVYEMHHPRQLHEMFFIILLGFYFIVNSIWLTLPVESAALTF